MTRTMTTTLSVNRRAAGASTVAAAAILLALGSGCSTSQHTSTARPVDAPADEAAASPAVDGGAASEEASGEGAAPVDAGELPSSSSAKPTYMNDQLMLKIKAEPGSVSAAALKAQVEEATGAAVDGVRVGPLGTYLIVFVPLDPPRDEDQLDALQAALEATDAFEYVQRNRLYEAKGDEGETP